MSASTVATVSASASSSSNHPPPTAQDMGASPQKFIGAVKDEWQLYSDRACDYTIGEPIGFGASSIVYAAQWKPADDPNALSIPCALKVLDLDSLPPRSLQLLQRETTLMSLSKHPNVLRVRGSWIEGHKLYIALRLMNKGSAADVMRYGWPGGMEEEVVKCILRQALKGLNYLHVNGFIHRDIKAANLLIDDDGTVLLGDLGVAADLSEDPRHHHSTTSAASKSSKISAAAALSQPRVISSNTAATTMMKPEPISRPPIGKRKSFVGTPCWMAPELIQGKQYDASADIWSFAITAIELCQGHPPRFRESPQKVLLRTLQEEPPTLNRQGTYKYTRAFKDMVDSCLVKDPSKRPTAEQLLQTPFFRSAKKKSYLVNAILKNLPPLVQRQERRRLPSLASPSSIDSWDFATTINSPATSTLRRLALEEFAATSEEQEEFSGDEVFEMESELTPSSTMKAMYPYGQPSATADHHSEFDYGNEGDPDGEDDLDDGGESSTSATQASSTGGSVLSRSLTPSTQGTGESPMRDADQGTGSNASTAPSSYVASSSPIALGKRRGAVPALEQESAASSVSSSGNEVGAVSRSLPQPKSVEATVVSHRQVIASSTTAPTLSSSSPLTKVASAMSENDLGRKRDKGTKMWKKLKNGLRPSSSSGLLKDLAEKDKGGGGKIGGLFASASRGTLGRSSAK